nr:hypothetical protein OH820_18265 [Streptomyces sp. NBC_00857]
MADTSSPIPHATWWKAPLAASLPGLPLLVWEYAVFRDTGLANQILWGIALLVVAWTLPHHKSLRGVRMTAAIGALGLAMLPLVYAVAMGMAMAYS